MIAHTQNSALADSMHALLVVLQVYNAVGNSLVVER